MKTFTFLMLILLILPGYSQHDLIRVVGSQLLYSDTYYHQKNQDEKETLQKNKVQSRTITNYHKRTKTKTVETYDSFGNLLTYTNFNKKGEQRYAYTYSYDNENRLIHYNYNKGKKKSWQKTEYDKSGQLIRSHGYNSKGEYFGREEFLREDGQMLACTIWRKDSLAPYKRLDYEYYEDGSLKTIRYFFKSKLKYTWSYECKPEGELIGSEMKENSTICISEERDESGNRIVWRQELDEKGGLIKSKNIYENDSILLCSEYYDSDGNLRSQKTYFKDGGHLYFS